MKEFRTLADIRAVLQDLPEADGAARAAAEKRNGELTKPPGALGRLEEVALFFAGWQGTGKPALAAPQVVIFAGNHGIAARGVSAFPAEVTVPDGGEFRCGRRGDQPAGADLRRLALGGVAGA